MKTSAPESIKNVDSFGIVRIDFFSWAYLMLIKFALQDIRKPIPIWRVCVAKMRCVARSAQLKFGVWINRLYFVDLGPVYTVPDEFGTVHQFVWTIIYYLRHYLIGLVSKTSNLCSNKGFFSFALHFANEKIDVSLWGNF